MPTKTKATHIGTCQVCGVQHKLPDGRLARHGYTRNHGYRVDFISVRGKCIGSHHLPYETHKDLLQKLIDRGTQYLLENPYVNPPLGYNSAARNDEPAEHREWRGRQRGRTQWEWELPRLKHLVDKWQPRELTPIC